MSNNSNNNFLNFLLGAIVGGIIALLFAPKKGSETREDVKNFINELKERNFETLDDTKQEISDIQEIKRDLK